MGTVKKITDFINIIKVIIDYLNNFMYAVTKNVWTPSACLVIFKK